MYNFYAVNISMVNVLKFQNLKSIPFWPKFCFKYSFFFFFLSETLVYEILGHLTVLITIKRSN